MSVTKIPVPEDSEPDNIPVKNIQIDPIINALFFLVPSLA